MDIHSLATRIQEATWAYHNTDTPLMSDDEYDILVEKLRALAPTHPLLTSVGATPTTGVQLPVPLASLDKVRMGESSLQRWQKRRGIMGVETCVVSEKLDGLSGLYTYQHGKPATLYLRGNGVKGVDVSRVLSALSVPAEPCMVRGEIVLPNQDTPAGSIGRSLVNGWAHRSLDPSAPVPKELAKVHFVAYQVMTPTGMTRSQQMVWLNAKGFRTPAWKKLPLTPLLDATLYDVLVKAKAESIYPLDGVVVGTDTVPVTSAELKNPPDAVAFKASLEEQKQSTRVIFVEWNVSRLGVWIPRIQIEPVVIGGAKIEWLTGHSAKIMSEMRVGVGARIIVRRSGDVIPTLDSVLEGVEPSMPPGAWAWDVNHVHAVVPKEGNASVAEKALLHAFQTLGVEGIGPGLVANLVKAGIHTVPGLLAADQALLRDALGPGRAVTTKELLTTKIAEASMSTLMVASNLLPRGVGERKLKPLFANDSSPRRWTVREVEGWSKETLEGLFAVLPAVLAWCESVKPGSASADAETEAKAKTSAQTEANQDPTGKPVVFTGCRPTPALLEKMTRSGWAMADSLTKKTQLLVHADKTTSVKIQKAKADGIPILSLSDFMERLP
jgi:DNA ligase (NAD+)